MAIEKEKLPQHVAFIMDGNGRWAKRHNVAREQGHRAGAKAMQNIVDYAGKLKIPYLTFYAFSTENWKRPREEVQALMLMLEEYLGDIEKKLGSSGRLLILGDMQPLSERLRCRVENVERITRNNKGITVNIAFNYGGRDELVSAARRLAVRCLAGELTPEQIDEQSFSASLYTAGQPDPDIIVRPSGEQRLSNFLLWQAAYAELIYMDTLWPDFDTDCFDKVLEQYAQRDRRFGGRPNS